ncbi:MAG: hypothetical protein EOO88_19415 [Pedobacter sp.]|nr:MAG: hypothetical protein EOO88_19415 [Pedobacter sp.]
MNILQRIARAIIHSSFKASVRTIEIFNDLSVYQAKSEELRKMPEGTLGRDIVHCLDTHGLRLVPGYESHDLKHVLLGFEMNPVDEIRLQAFMLGNGNYSWASFAIFFFGAIFLPDMWTMFIRDYRCGQRSAPIKDWTIEQYARSSTTTLREVINNYQPKPRIDRGGVFQTGIALSVSLGSMGMIVSLPFLFSSNLADLIGAGCAFVGGAVIACAGLVSMAISRKQQFSSTKSL